MCRRGGAPGADDDAEAQDVVDVRGALVLSEHLGEGRCHLIVSNLVVLCAFIVSGDSKQSLDGKQNGGYLRQELTFAIAIAALKCCDGQDHGKKHYPVA